MNWPGFRPRPRCHRPRRAARTSQTAFACHPHGSQRGFDGQQERQDEQRDHKARPMPGLAIETGLLDDHRHDLRPRVLFRRLHRCLDLRAISFVSLPIYQSPLAPPPPKSPPPPEKPPRPPEGSSAPSAGPHCCMKPVIPHASTPAPRPPHCPTTPADSNKVTTGSGDGPGGIARGGQPKREGRCQHGRPAGDASASRQTRRRPQRSAQDEVAETGIAEEDWRASAP